jgi:hypothetical protein
MGGDTTKCDVGFVMHWVSNRIRQDQEYTSIKCLFPNVDVVRASKPGSHQGLLA